jgi:hypothetical protein
MEMNKGLKMLLTGVLILLVSNGCVFYRSTLSGFLAPEAHQVRIVLEENKMLEKGRNRVYYPEKSEELARDVLRILAEQEEMLRDYLGIGSARFGVVIVQKVPEKKASYIVDSHPKGWVIWSLELQNVQALSHADEFDDLYHTMMHERTEGAIKDALAKKGHLYITNRETRWIGDGLAELLGYRFSQGHSPIAAASWLAGRWGTIKKSLEEWHLSHYNLRDFKGMGATGSLKKSLREVKKQISFLSNYPVFASANYAMSFYYWAWFERELGAKAVQEVILKLKELKNPTNQNIERVLTEVAGQSYVDRIEKMDAAEALPFFEEEVRRLVPELMKGLRGEERPVRMACYEVLSALDDEVFEVDLSDIPTTDIIPGSPSYEAGLRRYDIIEYVGGSLVEDFDRFQSAVSQFDGNEVEVKVLRGGEVRTFQAESFAGCRFESVAR